MHEGHRERMRAQLRQSGMDSLSDVQVLEVLLYHAFARQDTNLLAHALIRDPYVGAPEAELQWIGLAAWEYRARFDVDAATLAKPNAELLVTDPGRGNSGPFTRAMALQGYTVEERRTRFDEKDTAPFRGRLLSYRRGAVARP